MPTLAYRITEWKKRYEVTYKGHEADDQTPASELRRRPLEFVRSKCCGHNKGPAYIRMKKKANKFGVGMGSAVFGIFQDLLELAGHQIAQFRGWILCEKQKPMTIEDIAEHIIEDVDVVTRALEILCDPKIGWIQQVEFVIFPETPEFSGNSRPPSEDEDEAETKEETKEEDEDEEEDSRQSRETSVRKPIARGSKFGSDSGGISKPKATGLLLTYFPNRTDSDNTTLRHILDQVPQEKYSQLMQAAKDSLTGKNPMALFVHQAKRLGFRGNGESK